MVMDKDGAPLVLQAFLSLLEFLVFCLLSRAKRCREPCSDSHIRELFDPMRLHAFKDAEN